jgi:arginine repressor
MELEESVGTNAGDDTIFVLCRNEESAVNLKKILEEATI